MLLLSRVWQVTCSLQLLTYIAYVAQACSVVTSYALLYVSQKNSLHTYSVCHKTVIYTCHKATIYTHLKATVYTFHKATSYTCHKALLYTCHKATTYTCHKATTYTCHKATRICHEASLKKCHNLTLYRSLSNPTYITIQLIMCEYWKPHACRDMLEHSPITPPHVNHSR